MITVRNLLMPLVTSVAISGCISMGPQTDYYKSIVGRPLYGQVNGFGQSISSICESAQVQGSPFCGDQKSYIWVGTLVGQHGIGLLHKNSLAVPKLAGVEVGDIIEYHIVDIEHPWAVFDRIAAKKSAQDSGSACRWQGSHFSTGGVVCDGWRWNKDYPPAAD